MVTDKEKLVQIIKIQAEAFLLDAGEFYPFGTYIGENGEIVPISTYLGDDYPASLDLIEFLEKALKEKLANGCIRIAAIAIDILIREDIKAYDAIEIRFYANDNFFDKRKIRYEIQENLVHFFES